MRTGNIRPYRTQKKQAGFCAANLSGRSGYYNIIRIENTVNEVLRRNLPVTMEFISQEEAIGRFDMKRLPEKASETVRIVKVGDYDECLCIGQHVENTSEIGTFKIISHDYKDGIFRMRFKLI